MVPMGNQNAAATARSNSVKELDLVTKAIHDQALALLLDREKPLRLPSLKMLRRWVLDKVIHKNRLRNVRRRRSAAFRVVDHMLANKFVKSVQCSASSGGGLSFQVTPAGEQYLRDLVSRDAPITGTVRTLRRMEAMA